MPAAKIEELLNTESMEAGEEYETLAALIAKVDNDNEEYVTGLVTIELANYVQSNLSEELQKENKVVLAARRVVASKVLEAVLKDHAEMMAFVPEVVASKCKDMEEATATTLLRSLRSNTIASFKVAFQTVIDEYKSTLISQNPMLSDEGMKEILADMVEEHKEEVYYTEMEKVVRGQKKDIKWTFSPKAPLEDIEQLDAETKSKIHSFLPLVTGDHRRALRRTTECSNGVFEYQTRIRTKVHRGICKETILDHLLEDRN